MDFSIAALIQKVLNMWICRLIITTSEEAVCRMMTASRLMVEGNFEVGGAFSALSTGHRATKLEPTWQATKTAVLIFEEISKLA